MYIDLLYMYILPTQRPDTPPQKQQNDTKFYYLIFKVPSCSPCLDGTFESELMQVTTKRFLLLYSGTRKTTVKNHFSSSALYIRYKIGLTLVLDYSMGWYHLIYYNSKITTDGSLLIPVSSLD